jgi:hypothetical protein
MGWKRGYYHRIRKVNGRVVCECIGAGEVQSQIDILKREVQSRGSCHCTFRTVVYNRGAVAGEMRERSRSSASNQI